MYIHILIKLIDWLLQASQICFQVWCQTRRSCLWFLHAREWGLTRDKILYTHTHADLQLSLLAAEQSGRSQLPNNALHVLQVHLLTPLGWGQNCIAQDSLRSCFGLWLITCPTYFGSTRSVFRRSHFKIANRQDAIAGRVAVTENGRPKWRWPVRHGVTRKICGHRHRWFWKSMFLNDSNERASIFDQPCTQPKLNACMRVFFSGWKIFLIGSNKSCILILLQSTGLSPCGLLVLLVYWVYRDPSWYQSKRSESWPIGIENLWKSRFMTHHSHGNGSFTED